MDNNSNKKNIFSAPASATPSNYRSLSSLNSSSVNQPVYRGLATKPSTPSVSAALSQERGLTVSQQAKQLGNNLINPDNIVIINQKETKSSSVVDSKEKSLLASEDEVFVARDFPIIGFPLSQSYVVVNDQSKLDPAMKSISISLKGQNKPSKGSIKAQCENGTEIKVCAYRDTKSGKFYIEFNRLDGCAFIFQRAFVEAKLAAAAHLENVDSKTTQAELALINLKLSFWYGQEPSSLDPLVSGKTQAA